MGYFEYLFLNSHDSRLCPTTSKNTEETHFREVLWQPKFGDTERHAAAYTTFSKRIHNQIIDTREIFPLFVFEVKIYCMDNAVFCFHR